MILQKHKETTHLKCFNNNKILENTGIVISKEKNSFAK